MVILPVDAIYQSEEGYYAINNQFLVNGPKGFTEVKILENEDTFVRMDLPGAGLGLFDISVDKSKKVLTIEAVAQTLDPNDSSHRNYTTTTRIYCNCCEISGFANHLSDGVLRLTISKTPINIPQRFSSNLSLGAPSPIGAPGPSSRENIRGPCPQRIVRTDPNDPGLTGRRLMPHPFVTHGPRKAYEYTKLPDGSLYVRLDMPGVPKNDFTVSVANGRVKVTGQAPAVSHDSAPRLYSGDVAMLSAIPVGYVPWPKLKSVAENGVIRILISPP